MKHAIISKTRCQGRWIGDSDENATVPTCPYLLTEGVYPRCEFVGHTFAWDASRLKGCAWGKRPLVMKLEVEE